jgi:DNA polymerase-4
LTINTLRKIIHCDCDSFYASVEMRDDPALADLPLAVGGQPDKRGVVATCNYRARAYGIHSALPMAQAVRLCPELVILPPNMKKYREVSMQVQTIFRHYTDLVEPLSLDEAYLDVTGSKLASGSATRIAEEIRQRVRDEVGITISAGIAPNKFLAKIASDWNKPDGQMTVTPDEIAQFVAELPVAKIFGVGSVTAGRMQKLGLNTCADLQLRSLTELTQHFGKFGTRLYQLCRGEDDRAVKPDRVRKSLSAERTYARDLPDLEACIEVLQSLVDELEQRIERAECRHLIENRTVKVRFAGFEMTTVTSSGTRTDYREFRTLLAQAWRRQAKPVRLLGVGVKLRSPATDEQLELFGV